MSAVHVRCAQSIELSEWIVGNLHEQKPTAGSRRSELAAASYDLAIEHHRSIAELIARDLFGSAYALIRPTIEACTAGFWLGHVAADDLIARVDDGTYRTELDPMLRAMSKHPVFETGPMRQLMQGGGRIFHDFAHGGINQLRRRVPNNRFHTGHSEAELIGTLVIVDSVALTSAVGAAALCEQEEFCKSATVRIAMLSVESRARRAENPPNGPNSPSSVSID